MSVLEWVKVIFGSGKIELHRHKDGETVSVIDHTRKIITSSPNIAKELGCCLLYTHKFTMPFQDTYLALNMSTFPYRKNGHPL